MNYLKSKKMASIWFGLVAADEFFCGRQRMLPGRVFFTN